MFSALVCATALAAILVAPRSAHAPEIPARAQLARRLVAYLERAPGKPAETTSEPFGILERYPFAATAAYLLLGDDIETLRSLYPRLEEIVTRPLAPERTVGAGLIAGAADGSLRSGDTISPALNALAAVDLWSLHLISWKIGAYDNALEYLAWSRRLSETVTQGFYVPERRRFYPAGSAGRPIPLETPGELLPLVLDETLGRSARSRIAGSVIDGIARESAGRRAPFEPGGAWEHPLMRPVILDLLSTVPGDGAALASTIAAALPRDAKLDDRASSLWSDFWRTNPSRRIGLFPAWRTYPALVNLVLLLDERKVVVTEEMRAIQSSVDSLSRSLADEELSIESFRTSIATVNRLMAKIERFAASLASQKERWRFIDERAWTRLSPRIKRLVTEHCSTATSELVAVKEELALRLEKGAGISFELVLPTEPVVKGDPVPFTVVFGNERETNRVTRAFVHIGERRWDLTARDEALTASAGTPLRFEETLALPPLAEPGIIPLRASFHATIDGRHIELWRRESVVLVPPYRVSLEFPEGRRLRSSPLPLSVMIRYRPDHDIRGTVEGIFMKELKTTPALPARFLMSSSRDRSDLSVLISAKERLAPGRYPFSLSVSLETGAVARFDETLVLPFRWLYLGPLTVNEAFRRGNRYQQDLAGRYSSGGETGIRWREAPAEAYDQAGAVRPGNLSAAGVGPAALLYTAVDAPAPMKLRCEVGASDSFSIWINGQRILSRGPKTAAALSPVPVEIRKGPNSILAALHWRDTPGSFRLELMDENGYPVAGLHNELETIIDGFERIRAAETPATETPQAPEKLMRQVSFTLDERSAGEVSVIGSFNNWDPAVTPMKRDAAGLWRAAILLKPGRYTYKFFVDRKTKIVDPRCPITEPDGFGGQNSVLEVK